MKRTTFLLLFGLITALAHAADSRPNFLVIMADDMGYSDLGCYGGEIETPNLDRLAAEGVRFSSFYNCALCGPTRAALMTGLNPHQVGISTWTGLLNDRCVTLFEMLKDGGYTTCATGRLDMITGEPWHDPANLAKVADRFFGSTGHRGPGNYFANVRNTEFYRDGELYEIPKGGYKTDLITDFSVEFLRDRNRDKPFLLYMGHYAPHWPLHAKPEDIAKYRERYRTLGWDKIRVARHERLLKAGLIPPGTELSPLDSRAPAWDDAPYKEWEAERMAVYAAQIDCLDQSVGRMMEALRESGAAENTLVLFLSDNGASDKAVGQLDKPNLTWRSDGTQTRVGNKPDIMPGPADTFVTAGPAWSCVANTPFRLHKQSNHEGGIASPLIAWWPDHVTTTGGILHEPTHITDIMATCLDLAGVSTPSSYHGRSVLPPAGRSLAPLIEGRTWEEPHPVLAWATSGSKAIRMGPWKLVSLPGKPWELYNLDTDRTELHDLATQQQKRVKEMANAFEEWRKK